MYVLVHNDQTLDERNAEGHVYTYEVMSLVDLAGRGQPKKLVTFKSRHM